MLGSVTTKALKRARCVIVQESETYLFRKNACHNISLLTIKVIIKEMEK